MINSYHTIRSRTEEICVPLQVEGYVPQPAEFASPPKWHLAHTTWFSEEMILKSNLAGYVEFNSEFEFLFNSYYQTLGERTVRANRGLITRPTVQDVYAYRKHVDEYMVTHIDAGIS